MPLRNSEKPEAERDSHQHVRGPDMHNKAIDVVVAYVNLLEERIYVLDLELSAMRDRFGHQLEPKTNMPDMRSDYARPQEMGGEPAFYQVNTSNAQHPWDVECVEPGNPLGRSARERMMGMAEEIAKLKTELDNITNSNQELRERLATAEMQNEFLDRIIHSSSTDVEQFQNAVRREVCRLWGDGAYFNSTERVLRFLEEALELAQAGGISVQTVGKMVNYTFGRPPGEFTQELGGVMTTLAALSGSYAVNMLDVGKLELRRLAFKSPGEMEAKHKSKPPELRSP